MNFDPLSFAIGKHGDSGPVRDVVSYLIGRAVGTAGEVWQTLTDVAVATFTAVSATLRELVIDVTPVQSGSGDPSPTNVRPISGWTGANVTRTGKNLLDAAAVVAGAVDDDGEVEPSSSTKISPLIRVKSNTDYVLSGISGTAARWKYYRSDGSFIGQSETLGLMMTTPANCAALRLQAANNTWGAVANWQFEEGATATSYEAFGTTYAVSWQTEAGTVYGGTLTDNGDGTWTLVKTMVGIDMGTMTWGASSQSGCFYTNSINDYKNVNNMVFYCSEYKPDGHGSTGDLYGANNTIRYFLSESSGRAFNVHDNAQAGKTGEQFASAVSGVILVYELATPAAPITLTADSVKTLLGANNIFADCGNINTITYRAR